MRGCVARAASSVATRRAPSASAGLHLAVGLREARDEAVSAAAAALDFVARPLSAYYRTPATAPQGLVLGFGGIETNRIDPAVIELARAIDVARVRLDLPHQPDRRHELQRKSSLAPAVAP